MYKLSSHITIGKVSFDFVCDVAIKESVNTLTDTCTIKLPKKILWQNNNIFFGDNALIKRKDKVIVKLGYDDNLKIVFKGYVRDIKRSTPVELQCEDEMFRLKWAENEIKPNDYTDVFLQKLLSDIIPADIKVICPVVQLGKFTIENTTTPVYILEHLAKADGYGLKSYFQLINDEPVLFCGLPTAHFSSYATIHKFQFYYNIINDNIQFLSKDNAKLKVKCISIMPDNTRHEIELGDADGGLRTFNFTNIGKSYLKKNAEDLLIELKKDGYNGSITVFGEPIVHKADAVKLLDDDYVDDEFTYNVSDITKSYGLNGYRQVITIDRRLE